MSPPSASAEGGGGEAARRPRVGYLGPEGTFTEEALLASAEPASRYEPVALPTIYDTVARARAGRGGLGGRPDRELAGRLGERDAGSARHRGREHGDRRRGAAVGEALADRLRRRGAREIQTVLTHPQVPGQCERFLRGELAHARVLAASSTAEAVRIVTAERAAEQAALGTRLAAEIYGGTVIQGGRPGQRRQRNAVRLARAHRPVAPADEAARTTTAGRRCAAVRRAGARGLEDLARVLGAGAERAGWLVRCLNEFGRRGINLTKIESRPKRERMGSYMFFVDLQGRGGASRRSCRRWPGCVRSANRRACSAPTAPRARRARDPPRPARMRPRRCFARAPRLPGATATLRRWRWIAPFHLQYSGPCRQRSTGGAGPTVAGCSS